MTAALSPVRLATDQPGAFENTQMFRHGRQAHVEGLCQFAHVCGTAAQAREDLAACRVGQRRKGLVEASLLFNHQVEYKPTS